MTGRPAAGNVDRRPAGSRDTLPGTKGVEHLEGEGGWQHFAPHSFAQLGRRPSEMGYRAMFVMHDPVNGKPVAPTVYTGLGTCIAETVDTCLKK